MRLFFKHVPNCELSEAIFIVVVMLVSNILKILTLGDSDIATTVINESKEEGEEACKFLEDVRVAFPQVCKILIFVYKYLYLFMLFS